MIRGCRASGVPLLRAVTEVRQPQRLDQAGALALLDADVVEPSAAALL